jgi:ubiquinone/menaquinone biosynthesis C-methylase UbiE
MHERRFNREIERLRDPERVARMEVERVVSSALEGLNAARTVLDVGTGSGLFAEQFVKSGLVVTGLDANAEMLPVAKQYVPFGTFKEGVAEQLPYPDGSFDLVFMGLLLHEADDPLAALSEARRVARQRLAILEWPKEEQDFGPPLAQRISSEKISKLSEETGFRSFKFTQLEYLTLYLLEP